MLSTINANNVCMRMLWNDVMNELCIWKVLPEDSTGEINLSLLVGDTGIGDPFLAGDTWFLSDGRNIRQSLAGDGRDDQSVWWCQPLLGNSWFMLGNRISNRIHWNAWLDLLLDPEVFCNCYFRFMHVFLVNIDHIQRHILIQIKSTDVYANKTEKVKQKHLFGNKIVLSLKEGL